MSVTLDGGRPGDDVVVGEHEPVGGEHDAGAGALRPVVADGGDDVDQALGHRCRRRGPGRVSGTSRAAAPPLGRTSWARRRAVRWARCSAGCSGSVGRLGELGAEGGAVAEGLRRCGSGVTPRSQRARERRTAGQECSGQRRRRPRPVPGGSAAAGRAGVVAERGWIGRSSGRSRRRCRGAPTVPTSTGPAGPVAGRWTPTRHPDPGRLIDMAAPLRVLDGHSGRSAQCAATNLNAGPAEPERSLWIGPGAIDDEAPGWVSRGPSGGAPVTLRRACRRTGTRRASARSSTVSTPSTPPGCCRNTSTYPAFGIWWMTSPTTSALVLVPESAVALASPLVVISSSVTSMDAVGDHRVHAGGGLHREGDDVALDVRPGGRCVDEQVTGRELRRHRRRADRVGLVALVVGQGGRRDAAREGEDHQREEEAAGHLAPAHQAPGWTPTCVATRS